MTVTPSYPIAQQLPTPITPTLPYHPPHLYYYYFLNILPNIINIHYYKFYNNIIYSTARPYYTRSWVRLLYPGGPKAVKGWDFPLAVAALLKDVDLLTNYDAAFILKHICIY